jgi:hypothetical protein
MGIHLILITLKDVNGLGCRLKRRECQLHRFEWHSIRIDQDRFHPPVCGAKYVSVMRHIPFENKHSSSPPHLRINKQDQQGAATRIELGVYENLYLAKFWIRTLSVEIETFTVSSEIPDFSKAM